MAGFLDTFFETLGDTMELVGKIGKEWYDVNDQLIEALNNYNRVARRLGKKEMALIAKDALPQVQPQEKKYTRSELSNMFTYKDFSEEEFRNFVISTGGQMISNTKAAYGKHIVKLSCAGYCHVQ